MVGFSGKPVKELKPFGVTAMTSDASSESFSAMMEGLDRQDQGAAKVLYERYIRSVVSLASKKLDPRLGAKVDPESVAHSVMESFFEGHLNREFVIDNWQALFGFLAKVTIRKALNRNRLHNQKKRNDRVDAAGHECSPAVSLEEYLVACPQAGPAEEAEINDLIEVALNQFKGDQRRIIEIYLSNQSKEIAAEETGFSTRTVERLIEKFRDAIIRLDAD
jgi:hypothetical protein